MTFSNDAVLTVVQPGEGDSVSIPGFGAVFKLTSQSTGGLVAVVEHPFAVGLITPGASSRSSLLAVSRTTSAN